MYRKIETNVKGANAKNIGIQISNGSLITFPDDDCAYYEDTVASAITFFKSNPSVDIAYGRVYEKETKTNIMRNWPDKNIELNMNNFHLNYSAITCFLAKQKSFSMMIGFGTGAPYFSGD